MPATSEQSLPDEPDEAVRIIAQLEADGLVTQVNVRAPQAGSLDITFQLGTERMGVLAYQGNPDVRIVGTRREYDRPVSELDGILRDWSNVRRGWHS